MKTNLKHLGIVAFLGITLYSCSSDDDDPNYAAPVISDMEVGIGNSHVGYVGSDLHVEAEVVAEGTISTIDVEIHMENESAGWVYEYTYEEFSGLLNTTFHKHIDIPEGTTTGEYHFHFTVTDIQGNQTTVEEHIDIEEIDDTEAPVINITAAPSENQEFASGETISISGKITDNLALAGMLVALVRTEDNISDADVSGSNTSVIVMLHTHDFEDPDEVEFQASINVGAEYDNNMTPALIEGDNAWQSGNYYILIKTKDANGNGTASEHYPITINI
ncbi:DUF4625 domain-containing protein [Abyssalbus ytuae]|uniref:DUF4625 domain-containing protein n=1 Tax=Abyssalbus ytuae TaxID=2926907 RepID=A0A9E6ZYC7_9FLAO|nr:DUF4625 domain-containing protein [Abyssalbus ytuae]UOB17467.1 DUF4625 domain-containing protein [Abyssalbus ytuae]